MIFELWNAITDAQATILAAVITILGAAVGVVLGWLLLGGKVKDLEGALDRSKKRLDEHERLFGEKLDTINEQVGAILGGLGQVRGSVEDIQAGASPATPAVAEGDRLDAQGRLGAFEGADLRDALKQDWIAIRDRVETLAASHPDGRTRAKYGRFDRRNYGALIEALRQDGMLGGQEGAFADANALWQRFQRGRAVPTLDNVEEMRRLRNALVPGEG